MPLPESYTIAAAELAEIMMVLLQAMASVRAAKKYSSEKALKVVYDRLLYSYEKIADIAGIEPNPSRPIPIAASN